MFTPIYLVSEFNTEFQAHVGQTCSGWLITRCRPYSYYMNSERSVDGASDWPTSQLVKYMYAGNPLADWVVEVFPLDLVSE